LELNYERIRELALQAGYSKDYLEIGLPSNMEKFVKLIVRECCQVMEDLPSTTYHVGRDRMSEEIKHYFGVEL
jgi:hypothetical protein